MASVSTAGLFRPTAVFDAGKGLLSNDHFQIAYVTNDIDRAVAVFKQRFGVGSFRESDNEGPNGMRVCIRSVWIGSLMYEICYGTGPGMELYSEAAPPGDEFILKFHHFGYLIPDEAAWDLLEERIAQGGWTKRTDSDIPGFFRGCYVEVPELGHFLEFVMPRQGLLDRMNATPVA